MVSWRQGQWESSMCGWAGLTAAPRCDGACSFVPYKTRVMLRQKSQLFQNLNLPGKNEKVYISFSKSNGHKLQQEKVTVEGGKLPCWEPLDGEWITWGSVRPLLLQVETQPSAPQEGSHTAEAPGHREGLKGTVGFPPSKYSKIDFYNSFNKADQHLSYWNAACSTNATGSQSLQFDKGFSGPKKSNTLSFTSTGSFFPEVCYCVAEFIFSSAPRYYSSVGLCCWLHSIFLVL